MDLKTTVPVETLLGRLPFNDIPYLSGNNLLNTRSSTLQRIFGGIETARGIPEYWSRSRDRKLYEIAHQSDFVSGAISNYISKVLGVDWAIEPLDSSLKRDIKRGELYEAILRQDSGVGAGWNIEFSKFIYDVITQDNGGFLMVLGSGAPDGPIEGTSQGVIHLDSARCTRTGHYVYPVIYEDDRGELYKIHEARIIYDASMPSPRRELLGVGFSAMSRMVETALLLQHIINLELEYMGNGASQEILIGSGITGRQIKTAIAIAERENELLGLTRLNNTVAVGSIEKAGIDKLRLNEFPANFDKSSQIAMAMATIAMALMVDVREIFPSSESGASRASALIEHIKARRRGIGEFLRRFEHHSRKIVPKSHRMSFKDIDEQQMDIEADVNKKRSERRANDINSKVTNTRAERLRMNRVKEIPKEELMQLELDDGRLPTGEDVLTLFGIPNSNLSNVDKYLQRNSDLLDIGVPDVYELFIELDKMGRDEKREASNPDNPNPVKESAADNKKTEVLKRIATNLTEANLALMNASNQEERIAISSIVAALKRLYKAINGEIDAITGEKSKPDEMPQAPNPNDNRTARATDSRSNNGTQLRQNNGVGQDRQATKQRSGYKSAIEDNAAQLYTEQDDMFDFFLNMTTAMNTYLTEAFHEGIVKGGGNVSGITGAALNAMLSEIQYQISFISSFANRVNQVRNDGLSFSTLNNNIEMWANSYNSLVNLGMTYADDTQLLQWNVTPGKDTCKTCAGNNGVTKTASEWRKGAMPQSRNLECGGWHCGCYFTIV